MAEIRVLDSTARCMQRLGYLKRLVRRVVAVNTSSLDNLGRDLTQTVIRKVRVPLTADRVTYIRQRLRDRAYNGLKKQAAAWREGEEAVVAMELQDLYLADSTLPSQTGKLVRNDWRKYPPLGINLGLIRAGTYSANTRALSLLHLSTEEEIQAFLEYWPEVNPLRLNQQQSLLLLYSFLENDGEVIAPLWKRLLHSESLSFTDRDAGDLLPEIYRNIIARHRTRILSADERDRLLALEQSAESIARWRDAERYVGGAREEASRPRVEPYVDLGILTKPDPLKYEYAFSSAGRVWSEALEGIETSEAVADFLSGRFFSVVAIALSMQARKPSESEEIIPYMHRAWQVIHSAGGYAPIEEMALVAGIEALLEDDLIIEQAEAREAIIAYQKANPYQMRFTVNRMGVLAHARFLNKPFGE